MSTNPPPGPYTPPGTDPTGNPRPPQNPPPQPAVEKTPNDIPQRADLGEHYAVEDGILPVLKLNDICEIRIDISDEKVSLTVGPRDWQWKRGCPDIEGCGTLFDPPAA